MFLLTDSGLYLHLNRNGLNKSIRLVVVLVVVPVHTLAYSYDSEDWISLTYASVDGVVEAV